MLLRCYQVVDVDDSLIEEEVQKYILIAYPDEPNDKGVYLSNETIRDNRFSPLIHFLKNILDGSFYRVI